MKIRLGFISDLHTLQNAWYDNLIYGHWGYELEQKWNDLDILIFAGDCTSRGSENDVDIFMNWFNMQPAKEKVMIAGNHDYFFDYELKEKNIRHPWETHPELLVNNMLNKYPNIHYLNDSGVELYGLNIWGSPVQPWFYDWAFNRLRNTKHFESYKEPYVKEKKYIKEHWDLIPKNTDILITHGPPYGYGDLLEPRFRRGDEDRVGCIDLMNRIKEVKPKVSVFGHIHEGYGVSEDEHTKYINASSLNSHYKPINPPIFIDLDII